jgi:hypothetical protein
MIHDPDCPLFLETQIIEGEGRPGRPRKKTLIRVITDQLPKPRKLFENEKNALKISEEKIISAINQHISKAKINIDDMSEEKLHEWIKTLKNLKDIKLDVSKNSKSLKENIILQGNIENDNVKNQDIIKYKTIIKKIGGDNTFEWLKKNYKKVYQAIHDKYINSGSLSTFTSNIFMLSNMMLHTSAAEKIKNYAGQLITLGWKITKKIQDRYLDNEVVNKDNFLFFEVSIETLKNLKVKWIEMFKEFKDSNNYNNFISNNERFILHTQYLGLALNILTAPLRQELLNALFIKNCSDPKPKLGDSYNALWYDQEKHIWMFVLNKDKVSNKKKGEIFNYSENLFFQNGIELSDILNQSYEMHPRKYIFQTLKGEPMQKDMYYKILSKIIWADNKKHVITQNILRQSHHMYWRSKNIYSLKDYTIMANRSRHSLSVADSIYYKRDFRNDAKEIETPNKEIETPNKEIEPREQKTSARQKTQQKTNTKYFDKNSYGKIRLSDNRYLDYLKKGMIKQPTPSTLAAHGIIEVDGDYQFSEEKKAERDRHSAKGSGYQLDEDTHKELEEKKQEAKKKASKKRPATPNIIVSG